MEKKLRHSRQREMIYEYLLNTDGHPSADTVYEALREEMPNLSLGTVYRNLRLLEENGMIRRVSASQSVERYDAKCFDHAHFVCERCGCVKDLKGLDLGALGKSCNVDPLDRIEWMDIIFGGICSDCSANDQKETESAPTSV